MKKNRGLIVLNILFLLFIGYTMMHDYYKRIDTLGNYQNEVYLQNVNNDSPHNVAAMLEASANYQANFYKIIENEKQIVIYGVFADPHLNYKIFNFDPQILDNFKENVVIDQPFFLKDIVIKPLSSIATDEIAGEYKVQFQNYANVEKFKDFGIENNWNLTLRVYEQSSNYQFFIVVLLYVFFFFFITVKRNFTIKNNPQQFGNLQLCGNNLYDMLKFYLSLTYQTLLICFITIDIIVLYLNYHLHVFNIFNLLLLQILILLFDGLFAVVTIKNLNKITINKLLKGYKNTKLEAEIINIFKVLISFLLTIFIIISLFLGIFYYNNLKHYNENYRPIENFAYFDSQLGDDNPGSFIQNDLKLYKIMKAKIGYENILYYDSSAGKMVYDPQRDASVDKTRYLKQAKISLNRLGLKLLNQDLYHDVVNQLIDDKINLIIPTSFDINDLEILDLPVQSEINLIYLPAYQVRLLQGVESNNLNLYVENIPTLVYDEKQIEKNFLTGSFSPSNENGTLKFLTTDALALWQAVATDLVKNQIDDNYTTLTPYGTKLKNIKNNIYLSLLGSVSLLIVLLLILYQMNNVLVRLFFNQRHMEIAILKISGHSTFEIYRKVLLKIIIVWILVLCLIMPTFIVLVAQINSQFFSLNLPSIMIIVGVCIILLIIDLGSLLKNINKIEKQEINTFLKGEQ